MKSTRISISIKLTSFLLSVILVAGLLVVAPLPAYAEEANILAFAEDAAQNVEEGISESDPPAAEGEEPGGDQDSRDGSLRPEGTDGGDAIPGEDEPGGGLSALDIKPTDVCAIGTTGYATLAAAIDAVPLYNNVEANKRTIKMLIHHDSRGLIVDNKHITLDLNGKIVSITDYSVIVAGLQVSSGALLLKDPYNGEFNVKSSGLTANNAGVHCTAGGKAEVSRVQAENRYGQVRGARANGQGSEITVYGNVVLNSLNGHGAIVESGGKITIEGEIIIPAGAIYINTAVGVDRLPNSFNEPSSKPGYRMYTNNTADPNASGANTVWVKYNEPVCEITQGGVTTQYASIRAAVHAAPDYYDDGGTAIRANARTIKILKSHDIDSLTFTEKHITLDLNGRTVNIVSAYGYGLDVDTGALLLLDPYNGEFNVKIVSQTTANIYGVYCWYGVAEVSSVTVTNAGINTCGVYAEGSGSKITVYGDATINSANGIGACAAGGDVTVEGRISVPAGATYIQIIASPKSKGDYDKIGNAPQTARAGYFQYSNNPAAPGASVVWVRDPDAKPVCRVVETGREYFDVQSAIDAVPSYFSGNASIPANARTIKMLMNYDSGGLVVSDKMITLDLSGYTLNAHNPSGHGLSVQIDSTDTRGSLLLKDPYNGQFNVSTGSSANTHAGVYCSRGRAEVSSASTTNNAAGAAARVVRTISSGDTITVFGDVVIASPLIGSSYAVGAQAANGSNITIEGRIEYPTSATYIIVGGNTRLEGAYDLDPNKPGYCLYSSGSGFTAANIWVHNMSSVPVCELVGPILNLWYDTVQDAINAVPNYVVSGAGNPANRRTIKMLKNYDSSGLTVNNKYITLDLNGYTLNANGGTSYDGLCVESDGAFLLKDPYNGELNVSTGHDTSGYAGVYCATRSRAEVSNAASTNTIGGASGVYARGSYSEVTVYGDVKIDSTAGTGGARTLDGGKITIEGEIQVPAGATYISDGTNNRAKDGYDTITSRQGYLQYSSDPNIPIGLTASTVWVRDPNVLPVCEIVETGMTYSNVRSAIDAVPEYTVSSVAVPANKRTIKLLKNSTGGRLEINNRHITLDLNGYTLTAAGGSAWDGLWVRPNGSLLLKDPYNGSFNVSTASTNDAYAGVRCSNGGKAEVSSADATYAGGNASGAVAVGTGSEITVYGDVTAKSVTGYGVYADGGGKITIEGELQVLFDGMTYMHAGDSKNKDSYDILPSDAPNTVKPGYLQYSSNYINPTASTASTVWVRDPAAAFTPVADILGVPEEMSAGAKLTLSGYVLPSFATGKAIVWSLQKAGATGASLSGGALTAPNAGSLTVRATVANGAADGIAFTKDFDIKVKRTTHHMSITPSHAILTSTADSAVFEAILAPELDTDENYAKIAWSLVGTNGSPPANIDIISAGKGRTVTVRALLPLTAQTITVKAVLEGKYTATATVEILQASGNVTARLLESKATVNKAKDVGALVPVLITKQAPGDFGLSAFALPGEPAAAGSVVINKVELFTQNQATKAWDVPAAGYKARMYGFDARYIVIDAVDNTAKNATVWVKFTPQSGTVVVADPEKNKIALTVTEKYPKITLKAGELNLAFPDKGADLTATSGDGACTVVSAAPVKDADKGKIVYGSGALGLGSAMTKAGTVSMSVEVKVAGYKTPYKTAPKVNVKVVNTLPKLKLSQSSVNLLLSGNDTAKIRLISGNKTPFESGYAVKDVMLANLDTKGNAVAVTGAHLDMHYSAGVVTVKPKAGCPSGKSALIKVSFVNGTKPVYLPLKITTIGDASKLTLSAKTKSATVNTGAAPGAKIADIPITLNVANHAPIDWKFTNVAEDSTLDKAIALTQGRNAVTLSVKDPKALSDLLTASGGDRKHTLQIGSPGIKTAGAAGAIKTVSFSLTVTKKAGGASISMKNKIDIANPASAITATVKPANTSSDIASVRILTGAAATSPVSPDFQAVGISGKTFRITAAHKQVVPNEAQKVYVHVTLKDGQTLPGKLVTIKPAQTAAKAAQSKKAVTLYKADPLRGETGSFGLTTPANVKLGAVRLHEGTLKGHKLVHGSYDVGAGLAAAGLPTDGFRIAQSGAGHWSLHFADDIAPKTLDKKGIVTHLKSSYTVKLELWAEGTYRLDASGNPVALQAYDAAKGKWVDKSKPTLVNVKVNIK